MTAVEERPIIEVGDRLVLLLVGRLREGGLPVSTSEALDAISSLARLDITSRVEVRAALRATLVKDVTHEVLFQRAFETVFPRPRPRPDSRSSGSSEVSSELEGNTVGDDDLVGAVARALQAGEDDDLDQALDLAITRFAGSVDDGRSAGHHTQRVLRRMNVADLYRRYLEAATEADEGEALPAEARAAVAQMSRRMTDLLSGRVRGGDGATAQRLDDLEDRPLLRAGADELAAMRAAMRPLARRLAARVGAQRRRGGSSLDMRRTIRASMSAGGVPASPVLRRRRPTRPDLVILCDVSGSTAQFAPFTLTLLHALHEEFRRVRSFVFIDGIVEISADLRSNPGVLDPHHLLAHRGLVAADGRSDHARAFATFMATWGDAVTQRTTVIIAGDTRSHDRSPATAMLREVRHRARRLYWLNPEPRMEWDTRDSRASEYAAECTAAFEVATIRQLTAAVAQIV